MRDLKTYNILDVLQRKVEDVTSDQEDRGKELEVEEKRREEEKSERK